jgi:diguanylate cyclase (GGDEF)-like protein
VDFRLEAPETGINADVDLDDLLTTDDRDLMRVALEQTLAMASAETSSQLLTRTLAAACLVTGAGIALALEPGGRIRSHGDPVLTANLSDLDQRQDPPGKPWLPQDVLAALRSAGLAAAHTAPYGDTLIAVADPTDLPPDTGPLLSLLVAHALAVRGRLDQLDRLSQQAESDPLTGLRHSRPFVQRLNASSPGRTAIIAVDVDDFKRINDEHGHQAGDHALISLVDALRSAMRGDDQLYRIGGDEFAVIVDVNNPAEVSAIARRLLEAARQAGQTVSVGAALHMTGETGKDTLVRADKALYQAKRAGRDTARLAPARTWAA